MFNHLSQHKQADCLLILRFRPLRLISVSTHLRSEYDKQKQGLGSKRHDSREHPGLNLVSTCHIRSPTYSSARTMTPSSQTPPPASSPTTTSTVMMNASGANAKRGFMKTNGRIGMSAIGAKHPQKSGLVESWTSRLGAANANAKTRIAESVSMATTVAASPTVPPKR